MIVLPDTCALLCHADNIESNVETAAVRVESGNKQLEKAVAIKVECKASFILSHSCTHSFSLSRTHPSCLQRCSRKLTCIIVSILIGIVIAIIVVIVIVLAATGKLSKGN